MSATKTVVIVGGGFTGAIFGLKLHRSRPDWRIIIAEPKRKLGRGVAYGACGPNHLLNVPVSRMEIGLSPGFAEWLASRRASIAEALVESGLDLQAAYVPRRLFGDYIQEQVAAALDAKALVGLASVRGEVVRLLGGSRGVLLTDGREIKADLVVLAMGNLPPVAPGGPDPWLYDSGFFIPDPWAIDAFSDIDPGEPLLLIGTGLTMVDVALRLAQEGHRGKMVAVSRRGLVPRTHQAGGAWPEFLHDKIPASPLALTKMLRAEVARAESQGVVWQRVFDAARPAVASIWNGWSELNRRQFLRHLRPRWDVHRHRMAPRVTEALNQLQNSGALEILAGRIAAYKPAGPLVDVTLRLRNGATRNFGAGHVINCTGPGGDFAKIANPLIADLRERRLAVPDALGVGLETRDCAVVDGAGNASPWLFALGPLTRPAWWEITAVPEINLQIERLVTQMSLPSAARSLTTADFLDIGGGI
ncbi:pyridine nucleotide-disulfide oxidoreductase family [Methylocella silvestris BL2]|uniref:Pyridine nucleotide-disulfide oxidoreductase family n=1 Tax=Methylocella silvestris (strain DSM 15510 / CIP 108128 / LMG 27833 / NCIMB 13906 / BL2) TaxID=395965 RepID=B8ELM6_METSB|nr:FAD/NAD(P)-binding protein [Methylocella silvestris]ACK50020.1 pyridine nucleotide-disulfide oxidoreductase family [Methylocella silvestris BL2]